MFIISLPKKRVCGTFTKARMKKMKVGTDIVSEVSC